MLMMLFMNLMERNSAVSGLLLNMPGLVLEVDEAEGDTLIGLVADVPEMIGEMPHLYEQKIVL